MTYNSKEEEKKRKQRDSSPKTLMLPDSVAYNKLNQEIGAKNGFNELLVHHMNGFILKKSK